MSNQYGHAQIVTDGLNFCVDANATSSYPARNFVSAKTYSVYNYIVYMITYRLAHIYIYSIHNP